ncbi:hypothetical protein OVA21_04035 [Dietzia sp. SL131]|uniref:hypothetical protein n=1 Tax=Dietzia sp. SL131 TaxID=2995149 RepID=UPI00227A2E3B|nr:hypothetical protein [Dietzia sp. SL131]MCY1656391.1 hypothetical protein [Dietzia sp. SL131]
MTGMKHAIEQAARVLAAHQLGGPRGGTAGVAWCECSCGARLGISGGDRKYAMSLGIRHMALALAEAGLLAPAPLREGRQSEHTVRETAAYFARKVQRIGDRISCRDYRRSLVDVVALEGVQGFLDRIARDDLDVYAMDPAEGDGRAVL